MAQNLRELPPSKRFKMLNSPHISQPLHISNENNQKSLPAKKRVQNLASSSTSACLPAKKRVWAPHPVSPTKSETQAQDPDPLVEEKGRTKEGETSNAVPLKKRVWARHLSSPIKTETQTPDADSKCERTNPVPAKKRVWVEHSLTPALPKTQEQVAGLKSVQEVDGTNNVNEPKEIHEVPVKKRVSVPNPLSGVKEVAADKRVPVERPVTPASLRILEDVTNLRSVHQRDQNKEAKGVNEIPRVAKRKRVWDLNLLPAIQEGTEEEQVPVEHALIPSLIGINEKENNRKSVQESERIKEVKEVNAVHGVSTKKRVWAPKPLSQNVTLSQNQRADLKHVKEKGHVKSREAIKEASLEKQVCAVQLSSPNKTAIREGKDLKLSQEKNQTEFQTNGGRENSPVVPKRQVQAPEFPAVKPQIQGQTEPKPVKVVAQKEFHVMGEGDGISGVPLKQGCSTHPLSPAKTQTQDGEKDTELIEGEEIDDGVMCAICQSTDGEPSDPIVFCDGCDLMVHASCYGNPLVKSIPEGDWFCFACSSKAPQKEKRCCLCPVKGGALKPTVDEKWAHVMCALLVPEVFFRDPEGREGIDCSRVPHERWQKNCFICGRNSGCAIDCAESKCKLGFHVTCGLEDGLCIEYREGKGGDIVAGFCSEHTKLWEKVIEILISNLVVLKLHFALLI